MSFAPVLKQTGFFCVIKLKIRTFMKILKNGKRGALARRSKRAAFTLMEVLLAIAMISMLAFIVVVNLDKTMS